MVQVKDKTEIRFLMWNLKHKGKKISPALQELYFEYKPEILLLIENDLDDNAVEGLTSDNLKSVMIDGKKQKDIRLYASSKINTQKVSEEEVSDGQRRQVKERMIFFKIEIEAIKLLLVCIHFPSKFNNTSPVQQQIMKRWKGWIQAQEKILETENTILFGDFNLNPSEIAIYSHEGLSAHPTVNTKSKVKTKYYNPMWSTLGNFIYKTDTYKIPGTYYNDINEDNIDEIHWNTLDGLLIKKPLVNNFSKKDLEIITRTKSHNFISNEGTISELYSDHLPVTFKFVI